MFAEALTQIGHNPGSSAHDWVPLFPFVVSVRHHDPCMKGRPRRLGTGVGHGEYVLTAAHTGWGKKKNGYIIAHRAMSHGGDSASVLAPGLVVNYERFSQQGFCQSTSTWIDCN